MLKRGSKSKAWHGFQNHRLPVLVTCLVLIPLFLILLFFNNSKKTHSSLGFTVQKWNSFDSMQLRPTIEFRNATDVIWQIPDSAKAVIFLAHGCNGRAVNFWDRSPSCPNCVGLPEERLLVLHALVHKFAVLTISSMGRCWTFGEEMLIVKNIIRWWLWRNKLEKLPLVALGASSGGYFVSALATSLRFSSIIIMIAEGIFDQMDVTENYPPTLFVHMPKDLYRQQKISEFIEVLKNKGIDVAEVECLEFPLSPFFLADRIPGLNQTVSAKLFKLFGDKGFIDRKGYMMKDGRATHWKEALHETKEIVLDKNLVQHVQEELNLAFAYHEMTSLQSEQFFKWFESHMK
ncbi:hypothetical protein P3X46_016064 [Hevea brasiliensis]|uniref:Uncharacterized protein n=1 Tax=Hevea brasiliensis TaxID=3981 RepID=A0ABQ9M1Y6_HEVBR|nr:uncharacterized protein LOC110651756 [Hevea brasiliensis]KAJ9172868.1 hypothetical protein P3X46_016064 [Hevea brasiliensis]